MPHVLLERHIELIVKPDALVAKPKILKGSSNYSRDLSPFRCRLPIPATWKLLGVVLACQNSLITSFSGTFTWTYQKTPSYAGFLAQTLIFKVAAPAAILDELRTQNAVISSRGIYARIHRSHFYLQFWIVASVYWLSPYYTRYSLPFPLTLFKLW